MLSVDDSSEYQNEARTSGHSGSESDMLYVLLWGPRVYGVQHETLKITLVHSSRTS